MNNASVASILAVAIVLSAFGGALLGGPEFSTTTTVTSTVTVTSSSTSTPTKYNYPTNASAFVVFIDKTPQLRIAWSLPLARGDTIYNFTLLDASNKTLISFTKDQGAYAFEKPFPSGMSIGFAALSHPVAIGDSVIIVIAGHSGGADIKTVYPTVIQVCDPNRTWC